MRADFREVLKTYEGSFSVRENESRNSRHSPHGKSRPASRTQPGPQPEPGLWGRVLFGENISRPARAGRLSGNGPVTGASCFLVYHSLQSFWGENGTKTRKWGVRVSHHGGYQSPYLSS